MEGYSDRPTETAALDGCSAVILAGGKSSRMGRPKALLPFDGEPLIARIVARLREIFDEIVIVAAPGQDLPALPARLTRDQVAYQGPVSGIFHGLSAAQNGASFVGSCDMPFINLSLVSYLVANIADYDAVVPFWEGRYQPLFAVYRSAVAPLLAEQMERGELRPITLLEKVRTLRIDESDIRRYDPEGLSFINMNTPADYEDALERWRELRAAEDRGAATVSCTVELLGVARLRGKAKTVPLHLPAGATLAEVIKALARKFPSLVGPVIAPDKNKLVNGQACNINGEAFVRDYSKKMISGDRVFILSADAGG